MLGFRNFPPVCRFLTMLSSIGKQNVLAAFCKATRSSVLVSSVMLGRPVVSEKVQNGKN